MSVGRAQRLSPPFSKKAHVACDQTLAVNVSMQVGAVTETLRYRRQHGAVDTLTSTSNKLIEQQRVTELPLNAVMQLP